ncbi:MAG: CheR family methyltransferase, partial [Bradymonadaceae bacterium]
EFLRHAHGATYSDWSLRRLNESRRNLFFEAHLPDKEWKVAPSLRQMVQFQRHNLLGDPARPPESRQEWDIILCRNVLIYFQRDNVHRVLTGFSSKLSRSGYLLLGSSEQIHSEEGFVTPFQPTRQAGGFVYRLNSFDAPRLQPRAPRRALAMAHDAPPPIHIEEGGLEERTSEIKDSDTIIELLRVARDHTENGHTDAALACLEAAVGYDPFLAESYCMVGYLLSRQKARNQALDAFRKALFLEPHNWYAAFEAARLFALAGDATLSRQALRQTAEGLESIVDPMSMTHVLHEFIGPLDSLRARVQEEIKASR